MRVATSFLFTTANVDIQNAQTSLYKAQEQTGSGKVSNDLLGFGTDIVPLASARAFAARAQGYDEANTNLSVRLSTQDVALTRAVDAVDDLRIMVADALAAGSGNDVMNTSDGVFSSVTAAMNTAFSGRYVFGGVDEKTPPVNVNSLNDLTGVAAIADIFDNAQRTATAQISEITTVEVAPLADDASSAIYASLKRIADFNVTEPFAGDLSDSQAAFLTTELGQLQTVLDGINVVRSANGTVQAQVEDAQQAQQEEYTYFSVVAGDIENADLAEVASNLTQAQFQFEAVARAYNAMRDTTLLNYT